jgi:hypothetical protein
MFLSDDLAAQVRLRWCRRSLTPKVPVIAGASASSEMPWPDAVARPDRERLSALPGAKISAPHAQRFLREDDSTRVTHLLTGRPARGFMNRVMREIGPISEVAPEFPLAAGALAPLRAKAEAQGSGDFTSLWAGQAASLGRALPAGELTRLLAADALALLGSWCRVRIADRTDFQYVSATGPSTVAPFSGSHSAQWAQAPSPSRGGDIMLAGS